MPLTLAEAKSLAALGIVIPPEVLAEKARAEECRARAAALAAAAAGKPPEWPHRGELTAVLDRAEAAVGKRQLDAAVAELDAAAELLERPDAPAPAPAAEEAPPPAPPPPPPPAAEPARSPVPKVKAATGGTVLFVQSRIAWQNACKVVQLELARMERAILAAAADSPNAKDIAAKTAKVHSALGGLDAELQDKLDEAAAARTDEDRERLRDEARALISRIRAFADSDPLLKVIDQNPFGAFNVQAMVSTTLRTLAEKFG